MGISPQRPTHAITTASASRVYCRYGLYLSYKLTSSNLFQTFIYCAIERIYILNMSLPSLRYKFQKLEEWLMSLEQVKIFGAGIFLMTRS